MFNVYMDYEIYEAGLDFIISLDNDDVDYLGMRLNDYLIDKFDISDRQRNRVHAEVMHDYKYL